MILVDANIFMYAAGAGHPNKDASLRFLQRVSHGVENAVVDAEVLQEILHRYRSLGRWDDGKEVYDLVRRIVPVVVPIDELVMDRARSLLDADRVIMARDALHAAVVLEKGLKAICSFERDFDRIRGVRRVEPP